MPRPYKFTQAVGIIRRLFGFYPQDPVIRPFTFDGIDADLSEQTYKGTISVELVPGRFYFLLLGVLCSALKRTNSYRIEAIVPRSINAAMGLGTLAVMRRTPWVVRLEVGPWIRAYGHLIDSIGYWSSSWISPVQIWRSAREARRLWNLYQHQSLCSGLKIDGIEVSDLIIDTYLRYKPAPNFDISDPFVIKLIFQAIQDIRLAKAYFSKNRPQIYLTSYTTYIEHGIPVRVAMCLGVEVRSFGNLSFIGKQHFGNDFFHTPDYSNYKNLFDAIADKQQCLDQARNLLEFRMSGGIDQATFYMKSSAYSIEETHLPSDIYGAAVVFLHDFYDSPHIYPGLIFSDFWDWICFTIEKLSSANIQFFLKPHPNQIELSDSALLKLKTRYPSVRWLSKSVNNSKLAQAGIACGVTVYGTVAHELAYLGVPTVCCADHPHRAFDFCRTASNKSEYEALLMTCLECHSSRESMREEALAFCYMHNFYGAEEDLILRDQIRDLWRISHDQNSTESELKSSLQTLKSSIGFDRLVSRISANA